MYLQVVFNLPIDGPFDYSVPFAHWRGIKPGMRVEVSFGKTRCIGYIVGKLKHTQVESVKPIIRLIDEVPIIDKTMLKITRYLADYYACSWGQAIATALPVCLRRGKRISLTSCQQKDKKQSSYRVKRQEVLLLQDLGGRQRWDIYFREIKDTLGSGYTVILLTPDKDSALRIQTEIKNRLNIEVGLLHSHLSVVQEVRQWEQIKRGQLRVVVGIRMAIFAPLPNLGLIIIEEEQGPIYKQDSVPHYNAVGIARMRARIQHSRLILSSRCPSLETWYEAKKGRIRYILNNSDISVNQIKIIDLHRVGFIPQRMKMKLSVALEDAINTTLKQKKRVLLFLNRRGFAIFAYCHSCSMILRCPRCNANLILHFKNNQLSCHRCNYRSDSLRICTNCKSGYIRYLGLGIEKLESELSRLYPQINIDHLDKDDSVVSNDTQIIVATESIFKYRLTNFDLIGVISLDPDLNRPDFRAAEKVFALLLNLVSLTDNSLLIQTNFPQHYCFQAVLKRKQDIFYETELKFRRQSGLPPYRHIIIVRLRGRQQERLASVTNELFEALANSNHDKTIKIISHSAQIPHKKRDNFYEQILIKTKLVNRAVSFLKKTLNNFHRSGIIITVDVDPV